jgi:hypothetical protein
MNSSYFFVLLWLCHAGLAQAEIYKSVDAEGHVTYSSTPSKGAKKLGLEPQTPQPQTSQPHTPHAPHTRNSTSPSDFPKVDSSTQRSRDSTRRRILEAELATEEKLLTEARTKLKQEEATRSEAQSETKIHAMREEVTLHEKNVRALKTELNNVK